MSDYDKLKQQVEDMTYRDLFDEDESTLLAIIKDNDSRANMLRNASLSGDEKSFIEAIKLMGEANGCRKILEKRKERLADDWNKTEVLKAEIPDRRRKAVLNLKNYSSLNGQLVAAYLEEGGKKSFEELHTFCEELSSLDDTEFQELLDGLVEEKIISKEDAYYRIKHVYTEDLYHSEYSTFMAFNGNTDEIPTMALIYTLLKEYGALTEIQINQLIREKFSYLYESDIKPKGIDSWNKSSLVRRILIRLWSKKIFGHPRSGHYYIKMIGEEDAE